MTNVFLLKFTAYDSNSAPLESIEDSFIADDAFKAIQKASKLMKNVKGASAATKIVWTLQQVIDIHSATFED